MTGQNTVIGQRREHARSTKARRLSMVRIVRAEQLWRGNLVLVGVLVPAETRSLVARRVELRTAAGHHWRAAGGVRGGPTVAITFISRARRDRGLVRSRHVWRHRLVVHLHVFAQRTGVSVALITTLHLAVVRLIAGVNMRVLLPIGAVCKPAITAFIFALEWLLSCKRQNYQNGCL